MSKTGRLVLGDYETCSKFLSDVKDFYVYILRRPDGRPFYVGKGIGGRVFQHENEARHPNNRRSNSHKLNVIRSIKRSSQQIQYEIDFISSDEVEAYRREEELIGLFGRLHEKGPLTNRSPGGGSLRDPSPFSRERHSATLAGIPQDNPDRAVLNEFVLGISSMDSVVIKPISQLIAKPTVKFQRVKRQPTIRQAVALAASASANGIVMDEGCEIPRRLLVNDVEGLIENGVACDILTSALASVLPATDPADEIFFHSIANNASKLLV